MEAILPQIREKETKMRELASDVEQVGLMLPQMKIEKREMADRKRKLDEDLKNLQKAITKKHSFCAVPIVYDSRIYDNDLRSQKEELNAKKSTIKHFYSDQQFAKTISNLQRLLERNSFSLSEEKKYVQEIDSLKRSKKQMVEYGVINDELQKLLETKAQLRDKIDNSYRTISDIVGRIRDRERKLNQLHVEKECVKKELDKLYYEKHLKEQSRRRPHSTDEQTDFKTTSARLQKPERGGQGHPERGHANPERSFGNQDRYHGNQDRVLGNPIERRHSERFHGERTLNPGARSMSEDIFGHDTDRKGNKAQIKRKCSHRSTGSSGDSGANESPYKSELLLCDTLIQYLQVRLPTDMETLSISPSTSMDQPNTSGPSTTDDKGLYALPKKRADESRHGAVVRRMSSKKGKKDRQKMKMVHNMETLGQFATVMLNAPSTFNEVPAAIEQLKERKRFYEQAVAGKGLDSENNSPCSTGTLEDFLQRDSLDDPTPEVNEPLQKESDTDDKINEEETDIPSEEVKEEEIIDVPASNEEPPPAVCLEPADLDDETESGICSNTESIGAYSRSNSNSDCEPKDALVFNSSILSELRVDENMQEDLLLDDNSNLDLDKPEKLDDDCNTKQDEVINS